MATKKKRGASVASLTLDVLKDIRAVLHEHGVKLDRHDQRLEALSGSTNEVVGAVQVVTDALVDLHHDVRSLETSTIEGFTGVRRELDRLGARVDGLRDTAGSAMREDRARLDDLEGRVAKLEARGPVR
jgi:hypothetical protein